MHERVIELIDDSFVQLGVAAFVGEFHFLVQAAAQVVYQAFEALEGGAQRLGAHAHGVVAKLGRQVFYFLGDGLNVAILAARGDFRQPSLDRYELPDQADELIEPGGGDADARRLRFFLRATATFAGAPVGGAFGRRRGGSLGRGRRRLDR